MRKLNKKETKQMWICKERLQDCQLRLSAIRETLCSKGWEVEGLPSALDLCQELWNAQNYIDQILRDDNKL